MSTPPSATPPLHTIYLYITGACNLNCRHCWISPVFSGKVERYLPWSDLEHILGEAQELGLATVKVTGGEPFLHPEMIEILHGMKAMGLHIRLESNGTLIGAREAAALKASAVDLSISIDGPSADLHDGLRGVKGSFARTLKGVEHLKAVGQPFQVITCLHRQNRDHLHDMVEFAARLGAVGLKVNPITGDGRSEAMAAGGELLSVTEVLDAYREVGGHTFAVNGAMPVHFDIPPVFHSLREIRPHGIGTCGILNILGVLHDGRAGLCGIGEHVESLGFGDLLALGVRRVWEENATLNQVRAHVPAHLGGICSRCMFKHYCLGKCIAHTYYQRGALFEGFPFCEEAYARGLFPASRIAPQG